MVEGTETTWGQDSLTQDLSKDPTPHVLSLNRGSDGQV